MYFMSLTELFALNSEHGVNFTIKGNMIEFNNRLRLLCIHKYNDGSYLITKDFVHKQFNIVIKRYNIEDFNMEDLFKLTNVKHYNISNLYVSNASITNCFSDLQSLRIVEFKSWQINTEFLFHMFSHCPILESVKCINWVISGLDHISEFIISCPALRNFICMGCILVSFQLSQPRSMLCSRTYMRPCFILRLNVLSIAKI